MKEAIPRFEAAVKLQPDNAAFRANLERAQEELAEGGPDEPLALIPRR